MPIRAAPYAHQQQAFHFAMHLFGMEGGDADGSDVRNMREADQTQAIAYSEVCK
jgi:hypothetical protein